MFTVSLIRVTCSLYPSYEIYVHCIPHTSYMFTVSLIRVICPLYPSYELYVHCIPYISCYVQCTASAFASSLVTEQENLTSPNHNIIMSQGYLPATSKTLFSYSLPEKECDGAWYSVVPRFKFRAEDRLL